MCACAIHSTYHALWELQVEAMSNKPRFPSGHGPLVLIRWLEKESPEFDLLTSSNSIAAGPIYRVLPHVLSQELIQHAHVYFGSIPRGFELTLPRPYHRRTGNVLKNVCRSL